MGSRVKLVKISYKNILSGQFWNTAFGYSGCDLPRVRVSFLLPTNSAHESLKRWTVTVLRYVPTAVASFMANEAFFIKKT